MAQEEQKFYALEGTIEWASNLEEFSKGDKTYKKVTFWIKTLDSQYPQHLEVEVFQKDKLFDRFNKGEFKVGGKFRFLCNLRGKRIPKKDGGEFIKMDFQAFDIYNLDAENQSSNDYYSAQAGTPATDGPQGDGVDGDGSLPF